MKQYRCIMLSLKYITSALAASLLWNFQCFLSCKRKTNSGCLCKGCETGRGEQIGRDVGSRHRRRRVGVTRTGRSRRFHRGDQGSWHGGRRLSVTSYWVSSPHALTDLSIGMLLYNFYLGVFFLRLGKACFISMYIKVPSLLGSEIP